MGAWRGLRRWIRVREEDWGRKNQRLGVEKREVGEDGWIIEKVG